MSFRYKTIIGIAIIEAILLIILIWNALLFLRTSTEDELIKRAGTTATLLATMTQDAVITTDLASLESFLHKAMKNPGLVYVRIRDHKRVLAEAGEKSLLNRPFHPDERIEDINDGVLDTFAEINQAGFTLGRVEIGISTEQHHLFFLKAKRKVSIIALVEMMLTALFSFILGSYLVAQLNSLQEASKRLAAGELGFQIKVTGKDEIAMTARAFNKMSSQLLNSLDEIKKTNDELSHEILEREQTEEALRESEELYRNLIENIGTGIALISPKMEILAINKQMKIWFPSIDEKQHPICYKAFNNPPRDAICNYCPTHLTLKDGNPHEALTETPVGDEIRHYRIISSAIKDKNGIIVSAIEMVEDCTEQIKSEKDKLELRVQLRQAQKLESIGTLAGGIAHDFNNILTAILGYTELAQKMTAGQKPLSEYLAKVLLSGNRAKELVKQILTFSRQNKHELKPLQIHHVVKEALKLLRSSIPTTIDFRTDIDVQAGTILADPTQIHQVLMNLCTNAYHAMRETGGILTVELKKTEIEANDEKVTALILGTGAYARLTVCDNGVGIDRSTLGKIFEPYFTTKEKGEGTGLGLALVHGIVKSHGGHISVYSEVGKGTSFHVYLPLMKTEVDDTEDIVGLQQIAKGHERILIVDDEETIVNMQHAVLDGLGYRITSMTSPEQALETFIAHPQHYDLIITDMTMPDMTGAELSQRILALRPDIPIILCTGFSELINKDKAKSIGIREFIMKPVVGKKLAAIVRRVIDAS